LPVPYVANNLNTVIAEQTPIHKLIEVHHPFTDLMGLSKYIADITIAEIYLPGWYNITWKSIISVKKFVDEVKVILPGGGLDRAG